MTNEEKNPQEKKEEDPLEKAEELASRIEQANKETSRLLTEQKELAIKQRLGGQTTAGKTEEKKKEITPQEYAKAALRGKILE